MFVGVDDTKYLFSFSIFVVVIDLLFDDILVLEDRHERRGHHEDNAPEVEEVGQGQDVVALEGHVEDVPEEVSGSLERKI